MKKYLFSHGAILTASVGVALAALSSGPAMAQASSSSVCSTPSVSQEFLSFGDNNWYTPAPGTSHDNFSATGWTLSGGAKIVSTALKDGNTGSVLYLPPGASATSPAMCVQSGEPYARQIARVVGTSASNNSLTFYATPTGSSTLSGGMPVLGAPSWALSPPDNVYPGSGSEYVNFTYKSKTTSPTFEIYNLYVDPKMAR